MASDICFCTCTTRLCFLLAIITWDVIFEYRSHDLDKTSNHCFCFKHSQKNLHSNTIIVSVAVSVLNSICSFIVTEDFYYLDLLTSQFIF